MNTNFEYYKTFYSVAKNKNITKASNELMISQPAVSKTIKLLEEQLGCTLFTRNKFGVNLTEEGTILYENIKQAFEIIFRAEEKIQETLNLEFGTLTIGVSNTLTRNYLLPYIEEFHKQYPKIKIRISTSPTFELINQARNGIIDFIILNLPYNISSEFKKINLKKVHDCFFTSNKWDELIDKTIALKELNKYPLILISKKSSTRAFLDDFCKQNKITLIPEIELTSHSLVTSFTKIGMGIGYTTKEFIEKDLENNNLFEIKTVPSIPVRYIGLVYLSKKQLSRASIEFLDLLKNKPQ